ncbi:GNAT family N-acetyltransferase [Devosia sp. MC532]|uniref:GNAT family N-acetyltransferase n=1 Tax=Devosia sp. MC532 TaxID=2799788 RepID=UPI0018F5BF3B|nr:GNAT family N-acetyltransferase [Devosia sp. MC532]MBJ7576534.1 GNAT family N-acetyltransferase [Devosia sp. MC532]
MLVTAISTTTELSALESQWNRLYAQDPHAHYFLSYDFMRDWLVALEGGWQVLVARNTADGEIVALLPLRFRLRTLPSGKFYVTLLMAGNYGADYTGLICRPQEARHVIPALAKAVRHLDWQELDFDYVQAADPRYEKLLDEFSARRFDRTAGVRTNEEHTNNLLCPVVSLPATFDEHLGQLSANIRQKLRRLLRTLDDQNSIQITYPTAETFNAAYDQLAQFWWQKWSHKKGAERSQSILRTNRRITFNALQAGSLYMPLLTVDGRLVAGLITFLDPVRGTANFFMTGRDESYEGPSPGLLLHAFSIREMISRGYREYNFLRGDEPYKLLFGPKLEQLQCVRVKRRKSNGILPQAVIERAAVLATAAHQRARFKQAAAGYTQILQSAPNTVNILYRLGQLYEQTGHEDAAYLTYEKAAQLVPRNQMLKDRLTRLRPAPHTMPPSAALSAPSRDAH